MPEVFAVRARAISLAIMKIITFFINYFPFSQKTRCFQKRDFAFWGTERSLATRLPRRFVFWIRLVSHQDIFSPQRDAMSVKRLVVFPGGAVGTL